MVLDSFLRKIMTFPSFIAYRDRLRNHLFMSLRLPIDFVYSLRIMKISVIGDKLFLKNFSHNCLLRFV